MRYFMLCVLLLLVGCSQPVTKIDGATEATFKESIDALRKPMTPSERKRFERGIQVLGKSTGSSVPGAPTRDVLNALDGKTPTEIIAAGDADHEARVKKVTDQLGHAKATLARYESKGEPYRKTFGKDMDDMREAIKVFEAELRELTFEPTK